MQHITGISRNQMTIASLEDTIYADNPIRFIGAFVVILILFVGTDGSQGFRLSLGYQQRLADSHLQSAKALISYGKVQLELKMRLSKKYSTKDEAIQLK